MKVIGLYKYPVKSLRGISLAVANIETIGISGDRRWMAVDKAGVFQTIRQLPRMLEVIVEERSDGLLLRHEAYGEVFLPRPSPTTVQRSVRIWRDTVDAAEDPSGFADAEAFLSNIIGKNIRLVYLNKPHARPIDPAYGLPGEFTSFADGYPILLTTIASLNDLNCRLTQPVEMRRFRPNIVIDGELPWSEDTWKMLRIGNLEFRVAKPCARCVVTTRDPETGMQTDPQEPLATLAAFRRAATGGIIFGQNVIPVSVGLVRIGDPVFVTEAGQSNLQAVK